MIYLKRLNKAVEKRSNIQNKAKFLCQMSDECVYLENAYNIKEYNFHSTSLMTALFKGDKVTDIVSYNKQTPIKTHYINKIVCLYDTFVKTFRL